MAPAAPLWAATSWRPTSYLRAGWFANLPLAALFLRGLRVRLVLVVAALAVAVAGVCAIDVVNRAVLDGFASVLEGMAGRAQLQIKAGEGALFREDVGEALSEIPGVQLAVPMFGATTVTADGEPLTIQAFDLTQDAAVRLYEPESPPQLDDPITFVRRSDSMIVTRAFADRRGLVVGGALAVDTPSGRRDFVVRALHEARGIARLLGDRLVIMHLRAAQLAFARPGLVNSVDVLLQPGSDAAEVEQAIASILPVGLHVAPSARQRLDLERMIGSLRVMLYGVASIGVVLCFLVAFSHLSTEMEARAWQAGVLRAAGVRASAVWRELLAESLVLGGAGVVIGIPLGIALARLALPMVATTTAVSHNLPAPETRLAVSPTSLLLAGMVGLVAALLAAALPAWRASHQSVAEMIRQRGREQSGSPTTLVWVWRSGLALLTSLAVAVHLSTQSIASGLSATALITASVATAARPLLLWSRRPVATVFGWMAGPVLPFVDATLRHNLRAATLTIAMIGVGLGSAFWILTLGSSFERTVVDTLRGTFGAELIVASAHESAGWLPAPLDERVRERLREVPGVAAVAGNRVLDVSYRGRSIALNAFDPVFFTDRSFGRSSLLAAQPSDPWPKVARGEGAVVSSNFVASFGMHVGDDLVLDTPAGPLALRVVGIVNAFLSPAGTIQLSRDLLARHWSDTLVNRVWVRTTRAADVPAVRAAIARHLRDDYTLQVLTADEALDYLATQVRRAFAPVKLARAIVLLIVLVGMSDTLTASVMRRTRDLGALRAVGVGRRYLRRMVVVEALVLATLGLVLALTLGTILAILWVRVTFPALLGWVMQPHIPWSEATTFVIATLVASTVATLIPAHQAARLEPAAALRYE
jgi:putative ABC transport system permease protein